MKQTHPIQPIIKDKNGTLRFKENAIVSFLLDAGPFDMNKLAYMPFTQEDREQFAQLIGYSLGGFGELRYVSDKTYKRAEKKRQKFYRKTHAADCACTCEKELLNAVARQEADDVNSR